MCEVAYLAELQERFGDGILQFTVVREQEHDWYLHAKIFTHLQIYTSQQLRIAAHFLRTDLQCGLGAHSKIFEIVTR